MSWGLLIIGGAATYAASTIAMVQGVSTAALACGFVAVACLLLVLCAALFDAFDIEKERE